MELRLYGSEIGKDISVVVFQVVDDQGLWSVVNKLGYLYNRFT